MKIAVTGANSSVGQNLLAHVVGETEISIIAGVRSDRAAASLPESPRIEPRIISYENVDALASSLAGADCVVHLAGILIEGKESKYQSANVEATAAVVAAAEQANAKHLVFISVVGADSASANPYFKSKGDAEKAVAGSSLSATIIRTPILLGPDTAGAQALIAAATKDTAKVLGGGTYTQRPLDIDDLNTAILHCCEKQAAGVVTYELVGPEPTRYHELIKRVARMMGREVSVSAIPVWIAKLGAGVTSTLKGSGMTPAVIDVITMDEEVAKNADAELGISLTPLSLTLEKILAKHKQSITEEAKK